MLSALGKPSLHQSSTIDCTTTWFIKEFWKLNKVVSEKCTAQLIASSSYYLVWGKLKRWYRQREPSKPAIRIEQFSNSILNVGNYRFFWIGRLGLGFYCGFFPFFPWLYFAICRKNLLVQLSVTFVHILLCPYWIVSWHLLMGEIKKKKAGLQARFSPSFSSFQLALVTPPTKQPETRTTVSLLADWFIVHLVIVVT